MDFFIQPLVPTLPSYIRDSSDLISHLESLVLPKDCFFVTIDVSALYLNIPHQEGISATIKHLYNGSSDADNIPFPPSVAEELLSIILKHNYFEFDGIMYHQLRGTAMGTKMAPGYANLFMGEFEKAFLQSREKQPLFWKRYIDDIFMIWDGTLDGLNKLLQDLNDRHPTIKFTHTTSDQEATFLDITVYKGPRFLKDNRVDVKPHFKATNRFQYLHFNSSHPRHTFTGIVKGELTRILRASSDKETYTSNASKLLTKFRSRGYPTNLLTRIRREVSFNTRGEKLQPAQEPPTRVVPFVHTHSDVIPRKELKTALAPPPTLDPPLLCSKKSKSIGNKLVRARLPNPTPTKSSTPISIGMRPSFIKFSAPCGTPMCLCCQIMSKREVIYSSTSRTPHKTARDTSCNSVGVIYLIECRRCPKPAQYVGQTSRQLKARMDGHRAELPKKNMPIYKHFRRKDHSYKDFSLTVLEKVPNPTTTNLLRVEESWIDKLQTRLPKGLNSNFN